MAQLKLSKSGVDDLVKHIRSGDGMDFLYMLEFIVQSVIQTELEYLISAGYYEHTQDRSNYRNGTRKRKKGIKTGIGRIYPEIPKLRSGSFYPSFLKQYDRIDQALYNILAESYVNGVSTRKVQQLFEKSGMHDIDKSLVSRCGASIDEEVKKWRNRPLESNYAYIWVDAIYTKVRDDDRIRPMAVLIATGVREDGYREVLGFHLGNSESSQNWKEFFQFLKSRGLRRSELWISDNHDGIIRALDECFPGQQRQRCTVHWLRNVLSKLSKSEERKYLPLLKNIINSRTKASFRLEWETLIKQLELDRKYKLIDWLESSYEEIIIYLDFPPEHWSKIKSTNPIERVNKDIRRRDRVVVIYPDGKSCIKLVGALLQDISEKWLSGNEYLTNPIARIREYRMEKNCTREPDKDLT